MHNPDRSYILGCLMEIKTAIDVYGGVSVDTIQQKLPDEFNVDDGEDFINRLEEYGLIFPGEYVVFTDYVTGKPVVGTAITNTGGAK